MAKSTNKPNSDVPGDDYGIRNDQILEMCDVIVHKLWERICMPDDLEETDGPAKEKPACSISELKEAATTLDIVWNLAQNVLEIDDEIKWIMDELDDEEEDEDELDDEEEDE